MGQLRFDIVSTGDQTILSFFNHSDSLNVRVVGPEQVLEAYLTVSVTTTLMMSCFGIWSSRVLLTREAN
jgi:hypothetical protein